MDLSKIASRVATTPDKRMVVLLQSHVDALGADQIWISKGRSEIEGTAFGIPNGTVALLLQSREGGESDGIMLLSELAMADVGDVLEIPNNPDDWWYCHEDDVKKRWEVTEEVLRDKLVPKYGNIEPEPISTATKRANEQEEQMLKDSGYTTN